MNTAAKDKYGNILLKTGETIKIRLLSIDDGTKRVSLSMKALQTDEEELNREAMEVASKLRDEQEEETPSQNAFAAAWQKALKEKGNK
mmetsp:Transcript_146/g.250  ORF Transcript_146/g.250 Transcript_146/m.250 type:complete len:88 (+) Transcript_146:431-694(+)